MPSGGPLIMVGAVVPGTMTPGVVARTMANPIMETTPTTVVAHTMAAILITTMVRIMVPTHTIVGAIEFEFGIFHI